MPLTIDDLSTAFTLLKYEMIFWVWYYLLRRESGFFFLFLWELDTFFLQKLLHLWDSGSLNEEVIFMPSVDKGSSTAISLPLLGFVAGGLTFGALSYWDREKRNCRYLPTEPRVSDRQHLFVSSLVGGAAGAAVSLGGSSWKDPSAGNICSVAAAVFSAAYGIYGGYPIKHLEESHSLNTLRASLRPGCFSSSDKIGFEYVFQFPEGRLRGYWDIALGERTSATVLNRLKEELGKSPQPNIVDFYCDFLGSTGFLLSPPEATFSQLLEGFRFPRTCRNFFLLNVELPRTAVLPEKVLDCLSFENVSFSPGQKWPQEAVKVVFEKCTIPEDALVPGSPFLLVCSFLGTTMPNSWKEPMARASEERHSSRLESFGRAV